jgi:hypothetical protein
MTWKQQFGGQGRSGRPSDSKSPSCCPLFVQSYALPEMVIGIGTIAKFASAEQRWPQLSRAMSIDSNELNDEHPLVLELSGLRQTAARFQVL